MKQTCSRWQSYRRRSSGCENHTHTHAILPSSHMNARSWRDKQQIMNQGLVHSSREHHTVAVWSNFKWSVLPVFSPSLLQVLQHSGCSSHDTLLIWTCWEVGWLGLNGHAARWEPHSARLSPGSFTLIWTSVFLEQMFGSARCIWDCFRRHAHARRIMALSSFSFWCWVVKVVLFRSGRMWQ